MTVVRLLLIEDAANRQHEGACTTLIILELLRRFLGNVIRQHG